MQIQLQEGSNAHPHAGPAAAHVVGHGGVVVLDFRANPGSHPQAVAGLDRLALDVHAQHTHRAHIGNLLLDNLRGEVFHDLLIARVVAGGQYDAHPRVELDVAAAVVGVPDDDAGHPATVVLQQLGTEAAKEGLGPGLDGLVQVGLDHKALLVRPGGAELHAGGEGGELLVVVVVVLRLGPGQRNQNALVELFLGDGLPGGVADGHVGASLDEPVDGFMAVGGPFFQDGALVAVGALPHQAVHHHVLIHDALAAPAAVEAAVQNGVLTAAAVEGCTLLDNGDRRALFGGGTGGADAGQAGAHNHHVKVQLFADRIDDRLFSQPVIAGVSGRFLGGRLDSDAHGLLDAAGGRRLDGVSGDGRARDIVDLGTLGGHQGLLQGGRSHPADGFRLFGGVHHHLGNGGLRECHGHLHLADAGGGTGVGARGVEGLAARCGGRTACRVFAGCQRAGGYAAHGGCRGDLHKAFAGNFHTSISSDLFLLDRSAVC